MVGIDQVILDIVSQRNRRLFDIIFVIAGSHTDKVWSNSAYLPGL